jgi:hypothetical protein
MTANEPREIAFEDIKAGDEIEVVYTHGDRTVSYRGAASRFSVDGSWWMTAKGKDLVSKQDNRDRILLHSRPAPEEPKGLGAVVRARVDVEVGLYVRSAPAWRGDRGSPDWADPDGEFFYWSDFDPDSIEVLSEGIEVES